MTYNINDNVWVEVARDKERQGIITAKSGPNYVVSFDKNCSQEVSSHLIRPMSNVVAIKKDQDKIRLDLIPSSGIEGIGRAMTFGAKKYSANNWRAGFDYSRLIGSAMRHLIAWKDGQDKDPESNLSHLDHLGACIVMLISHEQEGLGNDDRVKTNSQ